MQVEELVQEDSRIDRYPRLVKGDGKEVWEWQGMKILPFLLFLFLPYIEWSNLIYK